MPNRRSFAADKTFVAEAAVAAAADNDLAKLVDHTRQSRHRDSFYATR
jgi:hypothetical protein